MPDAFKCLANIERDHSALTLGVYDDGPYMKITKGKITSRPGLSKAVLVIREKMVCF